MEYAKFSRTQPREWRGIPWECDADSLPALAEAIGWIALWTAALFLCCLFLGAA